MHEKWHAMPKLAIEPTQCFTKQSTVLRPQTPLVDLDKTLPRDNLLYNISTHMNLKDVEKYIRKQSGKHAVLGSPLIKPPLLKP
jgi:hypothetical protein